MKQADTLRHSIIFQLTQASRFFLASFGSVRLFGFVFCNSRSTLTSLPHEYLFTMQYIYYVFIRMQSQENYSFGSMNEMDIRIRSSHICGGQKESIFLFPHKLY